ncbi:nuclear transport factor 2 family protein [Archangium primigenium]|uniref:nuclear transport factor 2 family protein n=1 Tax=[Archangium] primigenium TaxID=2792470 RepID=UPI00195C97F7|nr:nuclear transport factor 2 family protein [Archangium primigenium]MBM7118270.1 nuclear transport factor 2 family protein [Archangium primigenium]
MTAFTERVAHAFSVHDTPQELPFEELLALYAPDIHFIDPFHDLHGKEDFSRMMGTLRSRLTMRFQNVTVVGTDAHFCMNWTMLMGLKVGPKIPVPGITEFRSRDGQLIYQRDAWDTLSPFINVIPGAGPLYRGIAQALFG